MPERGRIRIAGTVAYRDGDAAGGAAHAPHAIAAVRAKIGMVFQSFSLSRT